MATLNCTFEASYEISLYIAKKWKESYNQETTSKISNISFCKKSFAGR